MLNMLKVRKLFPEGRSEGKLLNQLIQETSNKNPKRANENEEA